jgi:hypothetical protein
MKKGQSSIEFLIITGIGLLLITATAFAFINYTKGSSDKVQVQQVSSIGAAILEQVDTMYALGANSWITMDVVMPQDVTAMYTVNDEALVFEVGTSQGVVKQPVFSNVPIRGVNTSGEISYVYNESVVLHSGPTKFRISSLGAVVTIQAVS